MREQKIKTLLNSLLALATLGATTLFWQTPLLLSVILFVCGLVMMRIENEKGAILIYLVGFLFGPIAEIIAMKSGAWQYEQNHILTIPLWLPLLWGSAALYINRLNVLISFMRGQKSANSHTEVNPNG